MTAKLDRLGFWTWIHRIDSLCAIGVFFIALIPIMGGINAARNEIALVSEKIEEVRKDNDPAYQTLTSYFAFIEHGQIERAWQLLSEEKRRNAVDGYPGFVRWLGNLVAFEGLKITHLKEKSSATTQVYIAEFDFKKRGMKPVKSIWGMYVQLNEDNRWIIGYSNILYEKEWKEGACGFWSGFSICNSSKS